MQISIKGIGNLVRGSWVSSDRAGFELTGIYCIVFLQIPLA